MLSIKRILAAVDFSPSSNHALEYAHELARRFEAELHLLHVTHDLATASLAMAPMIPVEVDYREQQQDAARRELDRLPGSVGLTGAAVSREVREGTPFLEIIRYARDHAVDLIVLGTHGRTGLAHVLLGSVAEKVVRKAPCPVLTVRPPEHQFQMP